MSKIYGLRWDDREFEIGEELPKSNRWDDGTDTGEKLNGTCAIFISSESDFLDYLDGIRFVMIGARSRRGNAPYAVGNSTRAERP